MKFTHQQVSYDFPNLKRKMILNEETGKKVRHYVDDDGQIYRSVTSVVGKIDEAGLQAWKDKVGEDVANHVAFTSANLGTKLHEIVERHLDNKKSDEKNIFAKAHFSNIKPLLKPINNIRFLEKFLCSKELGLAGTVDCVGEYDCTLSIIDFKTSRKQKPEEWVKKYFLQTTAYAIMWEEITGQKIDQIVILMTCEDGTREVFIRDKKDYIDELHEVIKLG